MAIGAQLDATRINAGLNISLTRASSNELQEVLGEDIIDGSTGNEQRRRSYWRAALYNWQWQFVQGRRGLLPTYHEAGMAFAVRSFFGTYGSIEGWWEGGRTAFAPEFVEWVEEQRAKVA